MTEKNNNTKKYYVYSHSHNNEIFYIGYGSGERVNQGASSRSMRWCDFAESINYKYEADIIARFDSIDEARRVEEQNISRLNPKCNLKHTSNKKKIPIKVSDYTRICRIDNKTLTLLYKPNTRKWSISYGDDVDNGVTLSNYTSRRLGAVNLSEIKYFKKDEKKT